MEVQAGVMQLEIEGKRLIASWPTLESVNSPEFFRSFVSLFVTIRERHISELILDSGQPQGGTVSEPIINFGLKVAPFTALKRVALLESTDFHWDNNLLQILCYLSTSMDFPLEVKLFPSRSLALEWLIT
ncbi:hypothetical protein [Rufibacter roseus]|uniref:STAS/SEC14 domain-containing protein n=1 Tax=Rufibacter roseus TaxID=1567108 RepID=A0ABW2DSA1_9BACT|nr:hypothetical protein [Rufibacter roseus]